MCYTKPGPRCATHAAEQVATASRKYQRAVERLQEVSAKVDDLEARGVTGEPLERAKMRRYEAQVKMYEAKNLLRVRRRNYDMTPEGRERLAQRAYAFYRAGKMREFKQTNLTIDKLRAEYELRLRDFHAIYGPDPSKRGRGRPSPDKPYPDGVFEPTVGWATYESQETELWHDVNHAYALMEANRANGIHDDAAVGGNMRSFLAAAQGGGDGWDSEKWDKAILAARKQAEMQQVAAE